MRNAAIVIFVFWTMIGTAVAQQVGNPDSDPGPDPAIVKRVEQLGGKVTRVPRNEQGLDVSFHLGRNRDGLRQFEASEPGNGNPPALDGELAVLHDLKNLLWLNLGGTDVTDQGLPHLKELASLTRLHLEKTAVSDAGLAHLSGLENLTYLNLYQTAVTDSGLGHLNGLKKLRNLYLWQTEVTPAGVEKLRQILPGCKINVGWD